MIKCGFCQKWKYSSKGVAAEIFQIFQIAIFCSVANQPLIRSVMSPLADSFISLIVSHCDSTAQWLSVPSLVLRRYRKVSQEKSAGIGLDWSQ